MDDITGKVALVTGGSRGIGREIALALAAVGADVAINYRERHESAAEVVAAVESLGRRALAVPADVSESAQVETLVSQVEAALGPVAILVNNAGVPAGMNVQLFRDSRPADWRKYVELNVYGVMNCSRAVIEGMCARGFGRIITISSGAGTVGLAFGVSAYAAGKGGGISFMRHLALENARSGVTANTIAIGLIDNQADPSVTEFLAKDIPVGRLGKPEDIAPLCIYLASNEAGWMTGQTIELNGGSTTT